MRWVAVIAWIVVAAFAFGQFLSDPYKQIEEIGPTAVLLGAALLIAIGGRIGLVASTAGIGLAGFITLAAMAFTRWPAVAAGAALILINILALRQINRDLARPQPTA